MVEQHVHLTGNQVGERRLLAAIGHLQHINAGHHLEHLAGKMPGGADSIRCHIDLAWIGLGKGDELGDCLCRQRRAHQHHVPCPVDRSDRGNVADKIVVEVVVKARADRMPGPEQQQGVAVRPRVDDLSKFLSA